MDTATYLIVFFFFFQAEDGIRDKLVTGVQTCALPIYYRPGTFERWGIGYRQLSKINPRLVYCWLGGFGGWGPGRVRASYDILGQSQGGNFGMTGKQEFLGGAPSKHTIWLADYWGGMMGAVQILAALYWREQNFGAGTLNAYSPLHRDT